MTPADRRSPTLVVVSVAVCLVALAGGLMTAPGPWSASLMRPAWHPPAWAFGPIWAVIGLFTALAVTNAWDQATGDTRRLLQPLLALNALFNVMWSAAFFARQRPDIALADITALWLSIAAIVGLLARNGHSTAARLLAPYLIWVSIAAALNLEIVRLNGPF